jgi:hypothetical protein
VVDFGGEGVGELHIPVITQAYAVVRVAVSFVVEDEAVAACSENKCGAQCGGCTSSVAYDVVYIHRFVWRFLSGEVYGEENCLGGVSLVIVKSGGFARCAMRCECDRGGVRKKNTGGRGTAPAGCI